MKNTNQEFDMRKSYDKVREVFEKDLKAKKKKNYIIGDINAILECDALVKHAFMLNCFDGDRFIIPSFETTEYIIKLYKKRYQKGGYTFSIDKFAECINAFFMNNKDEYYVLNLITSDIKTSELKKFLIDVCGCSNVKVTKDIDSESDIPIRTITYKDALGDDKETWV